ncbi:MAG: hypothetical protein ABI443_11145 [Chthoniobacterales bacterium]
MRAFIFSVLMAGVISAGAADGLKVYDVTHSIPEKSKVWKMTQTLKSSGGATYTVVEVLPRWKFWKYALAKKAVPLAVENATDGIKVTLPNGSHCILRKIAPGELEDEYSVDIWPKDPEGRGVRLNFFSDKCVLLRQDTANKTSFFFFVMPKHEKSVKPVKTKSASANAAEAAAVPTPPPEPDATPMPPMDPEKAKGSLPNGMPTPTPVPNAKAWATP